MRRSPNYLLIDISNSFTKIAFATRRRVSKPRRIATEKFTSTFLRRMLQRDKSRLRHASAGQAEMLVVCSVVPKKNREVKRAAGKRRIVWLNWRSNLGVGI